MNFLECRKLICIFLLNEFDINNNVIRRAMNILKFCFDMYSQIKYIEDVSIRPFYNPLIFAEKNLKVKSISIIYT